MDEKRNGAAEALTKALAAFMAAVALLALVAAPVALLAVLWRVVAWGFGL